LFGSLLPARIVTLIEVFCRYWVEKLIDFGSPYAERAIDLKTDIKYDLALFHSLHGQTISLGLLLSNSVHLSNIATINSVFSILLQQDFFEWLAKVRLRSSYSRHKGDKANPIIADIKDLKKTLGKTFDVRHVLVHEFPEVKPLTNEEIDQMFLVAATFIEVVDEGLKYLLYGPLPLGQQGINKAAREKCSAANEELNKLVKVVEEKTGKNDILEVQKAWNAFAEAEAGRIAKGWTGGTAYPAFYYTALKVLTRDRVRQLGVWIDELFPDEGT
jgi:hypothetical protein